MADVRKEGTLFKSPPGSGAWKKRYCILKAGSASGKPRLEYFVDYNHYSRGQIKGVIDLSSCTSVERGETDPSKAKFVFNVDTPTRRFGLQASSEEDAVAWVAAISAECFSVSQPEPPAAISAVNMPLPQAPDAQPPARPEPYAASAGTRAAAAPPLDEQSWLFDNVSRDDAERILKQHGATNGLFLVRPSSKRGSHALTVCWDGRIIHHLISVGPQGRYQLNGKPCHKCYSLSQVIEYLRRPHVPPNPLTWKTCLVNSPPNTDGTVPLSPATNMTVGTEERVFKTVLIHSPEAQALGFRTSAPCFLKASSQALTIIHDNTRAEVASWPLSQVRGYGCEGRDFVFHTVSGVPNEGSYRLETQHANDIIDIIRDHIQAADSGPARAQSARAPVAKPRTAQFQSVRAPSNTAPLTGARPPQPIPEDNSSDDETANYAADWDNNPDLSGIGQELDAAWAEIDKANEDIQALCEQLTSSEATTPVDDAPPLVSRASKAALSVPEEVKEADEDAAAEADAPPRPARKPVEPPQEESSGAGDDEPPPITRRRVPTPPEGAEAGDVSAQKQADVPAVSAPQEEEKPKEEDKPKAAPRAAARVPEASKKEEEQKPAAETPKPAAEEPKPAAAKPKQDLFVAACDYDPGETPGKLALLEGDVVGVVQKTDKGWWLASKGDQQGWVPADFLDPYEDEVPTEQDLDPDTPNTVSPAAAAAAAVVASAGGAGAAKPGVKPKPGLKPKPGPKPGLKPKPTPAGSSSNSVASSASSSKEASPTKADKPAVGKLQISATSLVANALADMTAFAPNPMGLPPHLANKRRSRESALLQQQQQEAAASQMPKRVSVMPIGGVPILPGADLKASSTTDEVPEEEAHELYTDMSDAYPIRQQKKKGPYEHMQLGGAPAAAGEPTPVAGPTIGGAGSLDAEPAQENYEFTSPRNVPLPTPELQIESEYAAPKKSSRPPSMAGPSVASPPAITTPSPSQPAGPVSTGVKVREMSNELRIEVMNLVKTGALTIDQAVTRVTMYEEGIINDPLDLNAKITQPPVRAPALVRRSNAEDDQIDQLLQGVESTLNTGSKA